MKTTNTYSEHQIVFQQQEELVNDIEKVARKFGEMKIIYSLETADELVSALVSRMNTLNSHIEEYKRISSQISSVHKEEIHQLLSEFENQVGVIESDENGTLHCGSCVVPYNYCHDKVGKKVQLSLITLNKYNQTRNLYPVFAKHIEVVE